MALDHVVSSKVTGPQVKEACDRTIRWIYRNIDANVNRTQQNIFPIIQGSIDMDLRKYCLDKMGSLDVNGYAIGGLSGGENKEDFVKIVDLCC